MGACATKPKDLETDPPPPAEALVSPKAEAETAPQENNGETEAKKEEPLVDLSEPEAPKVEEVATVKEAKPVETKEEEAAKPAEDKKKVEAVVEVKEPAKEEVKVEEKKTDAPKTNA